MPLSGTNQQLKPAVAKAQQKGKHFRFKMDFLLRVLYYVWLSLLGLANLAHVESGFARSRVDSGRGNHVRAGVVHNTPPSFTSHRDWIVDESHHVDERVFAVRAVDPDGDPIRFSLAPALFRDGSSYFRVDPITGEVFLSKSLKGMGANDLYINIRADDGHHQVKMEIGIKIVGANHGSPQERKDELDAAPSKPSISDIRQPASTGHDINLASLPQPNPSDDAKSFSDVQETSNHNVVILVLIGTIILIFTIVLSFFWRKWAGLEESAGSKEKVQSKGSFFNLGNDKDHKDANKEIALSRLPSQPAWAAVLEKREPVLKPAEFFNTLTDDKWEFPRTKLKVLQHISEGCFGQVWKYEAFQTGSNEDSRCKKFSDGKTSSGSSIIVAVKTLKDPKSEQGRQDLLNELEIMKLLDPHPNVVTLLGCCTERDPLFVIMEYISLGKLQTFLRENRRPFTEQRDSFDARSAPLTSTELTQFGYQVAKGMEYIASKGIVHRDLAARNVLVTENRQCKVADFGLARDVISSHEYERKSDGVLPVRWMPPEALYDNVHTSRSDVWAFGILLWEIVTLGSTPYPGMTAMEVTRGVRDGYRLPKPEHCKREMYNIMSYCWEANPTKRPCFTELTYMLEKLIISENDYIELERFPEHAYYNVCHYLPGEKL